MDPTINCGNGSSGAMQPRHEDVELQMSERVGIHVYRSMMLTILGVGSFVAVGFMIPLLSTVQERSAFAALGLVGLACIMRAAYFGRRAWLRVQYGVHRQDFVTRHRDGPWRPLTALSDIEEVRVSMSDEFWDDSRSVHLSLDGKWVSVGPFAGSHEWAKMLVARLNKIQGREIPLQM